MNSSDGWRNLFENWPAAIPRTGFIVTSFGESLPFRDFLISGSILLIDRDVPDSFGARKVMLTYEAIAAVKLTSTLELARFQVMGFQGSL